MRSFKDKPVLVTGAGRGIGKRLALAFATAGARVGLLARSKAELDLANLEIEHTGGVSLRLRADVRDYEQVRSAVERMETQFGPVSILVCAHAVFGSIGPFSECDPAAWADAPITNLIGAMHACRAVMPGMNAHRWGKILLLTGPGTESPRARFSAYGATNAGLARFAETLAEEVAAQNVQVNCMNPGATYTSMTDEILAAGDLAGEDELRMATEIRTNGGTPVDKQVQLAMFLVSERSNHLSGRLLSVTDDWKRLEHQNAHTAAYTLRRLLKV